MSQRKVAAVLVALLVLGSLALADEPKNNDTTAKNPPKEIAIDLGGGVKLEMVLIPAGEFMMGSPDSDKGAFANEKPQHRVRITTPFYLGKYKVTQRQWQAVMDEAERRHTQSGGDLFIQRSHDTNQKPWIYSGLDRPVDSVSWDDAQAFLNKLNANRTKQRSFVLPTEAQWEYACRAGSTTRWFFGDDETQLGDYAWYGGNSSSKTHPVGQKKPNAWGLYDMYGNVWEWCQDWREDGYSEISPVNDPTGPATGLLHVNRGGDCYCPPKYCRSAIRSLTNNSSPGLYYNRRHGLRVCLVLDDLLAIAPFSFEKGRQFQTTLAKRIGQPIELTNTIGMKLTLIPPGEFMMGNRESLKEMAAYFSKNYSMNMYVPPVDDEQPQHRVRITRPFFMGTYHVSVGQFRQFVKDSGYKTDAEKGTPFNTTNFIAHGTEFHADTHSWRNPGFPQTDEHPVVYVSWNDTMTFCKWLSRKEGKAYRLPTEAEWEYACRAGTTTRYYSGDDPETLAKVGNVADATAKARFPKWQVVLKASDGYVFTSPVGKFTPNAFGLHDMHGNAWQWCLDWHDHLYYERSPVDNPMGPDSGDFRVLRGGCWDSSPEAARSARRLDGPLSFRQPDFGFRVVRSL